MSKDRREQVIALGRLGESLRRIEEETGVRRETASGYPRQAGVALREPGGWGHKPPAKPAKQVTTGSEDADSKPAIVVSTGAGEPKPANGSNAATSVTAGFCAGKEAEKRSASACAAYREWIEAELDRGRNAMGIWQELVSVERAEKPSRP